MSEANDGSLAATAARLDPRKFQDPFVTAAGERRAQVALKSLDTLGLRERFGDRLQIRVSIDHYGRAVHETERGRRSWQPTLDGLLWLAANGFAVSVATRRLSGEPEDEIRRGFAALFAQLGLSIDA